ncbi:MAG: proton-conducting transporter membrane subunit [bacterium]
MLALTIFLPIILGIFVLVFPKTSKGFRSALAIAGSSIGLLVSFFILNTVNSGYDIYLNYNWIPAIGVNFALRGYIYSAFLLIFINLFGLLVSIYSTKSINHFFDNEGQKPRLPEYYGYLLLTIGAGCGAVLANDFIIFVIFWGIVLLTMYGLLSLGSYKVALKGLFIMGFSDFCLLLGILLLWSITHTFRMSDISKIPLNSGLAITSFILMLIGALAKAGSMPFHTWIPDASKSTPVPIMAFLPASLDKLLGIYLLSRICLNFFDFVPNSGLSLVLMIIGSFTLIAAVMMAMVQHNIMKLLSYHAVSQVGYMVIGIGTGLPIGIAGGLFHMVNNAIYKSCLFLCGGSAAKTANSAEIENMGGLSKSLPWTFGACLVAALSISGVPPFNGFFSKWMVYQGIIESGRSGTGIWVLWLIAAMFGSALTLASFVKLIHGVFLGQKRNSQDVKEKESFATAAPVVVLALLCIAFGIFAYKVPLSTFIYPIIGSVPPSLGNWTPTLATLLVIVGLVIGVIIYLLNGVKTTRTTTAFIGGEDIDKMETANVSGGEFYNTVKNEMGFGKIYNNASNGKYDFYLWGKGFFLAFANIIWVLGDRLADYVWNTMYKALIEAGNLLRKAHTGIITSYVVWLFVGMLILLVTIFY